MGKWAGQSRAKTAKGGLAAGCWRLADGWLPAAGRRLPAADAQPFSGVAVAVVAATTAAVAAAAAVVVAATSFSFFAPRKKKSSSGGS